jgi:hypothetical protein
MRRFLGGNFNVFLWFSLLELVGVRLFNSVYSLLFVVCLFREGDVLDQ